MLTVQTPPAPDVELSEQMLTDMQNSMPPVLYTTHYIANILRVFANELSSLESSMRSFFAGQFVATASGEYLRRLELLHNLSPEPEGLSVEERRERLSAHLIGRFYYTGYSFLENVARLASGVVPSVVFDNVTGTVTLNFAIGLSTYEVDRIIAYCEHSGPAHLQWEVDSDTSGSGFVVNSGTVGFTKI